jgi:phosphoenolpyruvate carboxykinase (GTP)
MTDLLRVDRDEWRAELPGIVDYFSQFGNRLPAAISAQAEALRWRLG